MISSLGGCLDFLNCSASSSRVEGNCIFELIIKLQKDMLETLGFEREWACGKLNRIGQDFGEDRELVQGMQAWAAMAQQACRRAQADGDPSLRPDSKEMRQIVELQ